MSEPMECKFSNCFMCGEDNKCHKAYQQGRADAIDEMLRAIWKKENEPQYQHEGEDWINGLVIAEEIAEQIRGN